jgi:transcriptional regulator with XRE-family HTH domain
MVALRRDRGLTQRDVGDRLGRSQSVVSRWERGVLEPTIQDLVALTSLLEQPLDCLATALRGPGRRRSRRGDPPANRRQIALIFRTARQAAELDAWTVARRTGIPPRRLHRLEAGAEASSAEFVALVAVLPTLVEALMRAGLDTTDDLPKVPVGPKHPGAPAPD